MKYLPNYTKSTIANRSIRMVSLRLHLRSIMSIVEDGSSLRMSCRKSHEPTTTTTLAQSHPALNPSHTLGISSTNFQRSHDILQLHREQLERSCQGEEVDSKSWYWSTLKLPWPASLSCSRLRTLEQRTCGSAFTALASRNTPEWGILGNLKLCHEIRET